MFLTTVVVLLRLFLFFPSFMSVFLCFLICSSIASMQQLPELQPQLGIQKSVSNLQKPSPVANQEVRIHAMLNFELFFLVVITLFSYVLHLAHVLKYKPEQRCVQSLEQCLFCAKELFQKLKC